MSLRTKLVAAAAVVTAVALLLASALLARTVETPTNSGSADLRTSPPVQQAQAQPVGYFHGLQQSQLLCPGADLTGHVSKAIVDPAAAVAEVPGDCTLADMRHANPETEFYAYIDVAAMRSLDPYQGNFQNTCADPSKEGANYAIDPDNPRVSSNEYGQAVYPDYEYLVLADLSENYAMACVDAIRRLLSTDSAPAVSSGATSARFDGIFLDDVSMSPAHGQDPSDIGPWGPWKDDAAYGHAMIDTVVRIDEGLRAATGRDVPIMVNLGLNVEDPEEVELAVELAHTRAADHALREFTVATGDGAPLSEDYMLALMEAHRTLTENGMPVVQHDYSVSLREVALEHFGRGREIMPDQPCLDASSENLAKIKRAAEKRRTLDHRMLLGHTLLARNERSIGLTSALSQAAPFCQLTAASTERMAENVTDASVNLEDTEVQQLTYAINQKAYALGDLQKSDGVWHQRLSNGQVVLVNTRINSQHVTAFGRLYDVPGRSSLIE